MESVSGPLLSYGFSSAILCSSENTNRFINRWIILTNGEAETSVASFRNFVGLWSITAALFKQDNLQHFDWCVD